MIQRVTTALLAATLLTACSPSPSDTVGKFYMSVSEGRIEDALATVDLADAEGRGLPKAKIKAALVAISDKFNRVDCGGLKSVTLISEDVRGDIATQKADLVCKSGKKFSETTKLAKTKDGWRVSIGRQ